MITIARSGMLAAVVALGAFAPIASAGQAATATGADKVPITTSSAEARTIYLEGRDLLEKLRITDAHKRFEAAVAKDKHFALGYLGLANTATTTHEFFAALDQAVAVADHASEPERLMIQGLKAGAINAPAKQHELYDKLAHAYPKDERALTLLANFEFGQQDYAKSIELYNQAVAINPSFTQPYNQLGYAYRAIERYSDAEKAFQKYIELIPTDPNPYDSYAELLMKEGRFAESIRSYEKALSIDANFVSAYVGIANNDMFSGRGEDARKALRKLTEVSRTGGERRQAIAWTAESYIHEAAWDQALAEIDKLIAMSVQANDLGQKANDLNFRANTLLEAGRPDDAAAAFRAQVDASDHSTTPADVKETVRRNTIYDQARVAIAKHDLATAKARAAAFAQAVAAKQIPFELRLSHELAGMIALADGKPAAAASELAQANQQDPRVLYLYAAALAGAGDAKAQAAAKKAAEWNALALNYGYVRAKAKALIKA